MEELLREEEKKKNGGDNLAYDIKFKGLVDKLEKLKIKEIDTINKFDKNNNLKILNKTSTNKTFREKNRYMSNIKLLEAYLSKDFRDLVNGMDKINIYDINNASRGKIQKAIEQMYYLENQKKIKDEKLSISQDNLNKKIFTLKSQHINNSKNENDKEGNNRYKKFKESLSDNKIKIMLNLSGNNFLKNHIENNTIKSNKSIYILDKETIKLNNTTRERNSLSSSNYGLLINNSLISDKKKLMLNTPKNNTFVDNSSSTPNKLKTTKGHYFLNFGYLKKRNYIKKLEDRELKFQKCLIRTKKLPMPYIHYFSKGVSRIEADNSFLRIKSLVSNVNINSDWKEIMTQKDFRDTMVKSRLESALLLSLDNNALNKYKTMTYKKEKEDFDEFAYEKSLRNVSKINKTALENITLKLNTIYENEQKYKNDQILKNMKIRKNIIKRLYKNKSSTNRIERNEGKKFILRKLKISSSVSNISNINAK